MIIRQNTNIVSSVWNVPSVTYATWNPADKSSNITLSGGNLIAQSTNAATDYQVRSTLSIPGTAKIYIENTFVRNTPTDPFFVIGGISDSSESVNNYTGFTKGCCFTTDGNYYVNGVFTNPSWGAWTDGQVAGMAYDANTRILSVYRNNTLLGTISGFAAGTYYFGTGSYQTLGTTTTNFGATSMVYSPPLGYTAGLYI